MIRFTGIIIIAFLLLIISPSLSHAEKAPFRALYNNDLMNLYGCKSPWNSSGQTMEMMIRGSVDETVDAGFDVHMLAPGYGFVPFWNSDIYPFAEHMQWFYATFSQAPNPLTNYMLDGGDVVAVFIDQCRTRGISPFISYRVNDHHEMEFIAMPQGTALPTTWADLMIDQWRYEHLDYCLSDPEDRTDLSTDPLTVIQQPGMVSQLREEYTMNWGIQAVRDRIYNFIAEVCQYDIDGLELDFMRHHTLFRQDQTTSGERLQIVLSFISRIRQLLDDTAQPGQHRWLCVRIPAFTCAYDPRGLDLQQMANAGVDMFNLSNFYRSGQQSDMAEVTRLLPNSSVYHEMTFNSALQSIYVNGSGTQYISRRTTDEQFYAAAALAYARGAQGVSIFNFPYYRFPDIKDAPVHEPPLHIIRTLADPNTVAQKPQNYCLYKGWHYYITEYMTLPDNIEKMVPRTLSDDNPCILALDMAHPDLGRDCSGTAVIRLQTDVLWADRQVNLCINNVNAEPYGDSSEPFANPYPQLLGNAGTLKAWSIPLGRLRPGFNTLKFTTDSSEAVTITFVDISIK